MAVLRLAPLLGLVVLAACGGSAGGDAGGTTTVATTTTTAAETLTPTVAGLTSTCENERLRLVIRYPDDWWTNPGTVAPSCRFFHPEPLDLQPATEAPPTAVSIQSVERGVDSLVADVERTTRVLSRSQEAVAGVRAVVLETESTGEGLYAAGTRTTAYYVDRVGGSLILSTSDAGDLDYDVNREVLERMLSTLDLGPTSMMEPPPITTDHG